jgi:DNA mismatch endonuclease (patch repair protein)
LHDKRLPGCPDIILPARRSVIFVNGCFWHGHDCDLFNIPKTRTEFWLNKIGRTKRRDAQAVERLESLGWQPIVVWECELTELDRCLTRIARLLDH